MTLDNAAWITGHSVEIAITAAYIKRRGNLHIKNTGEGNLAPGVRGGLP